MKPLELMTAGASQVISSSSICRRKAIKQTYRPAITLFLYLLVVVLSCSRLSRLSAQTDSTAGTTVPVSIQWMAQSGVERYRLQIASDEGFTDVRFDGLVSGNEYTVRDLEPGRYCWRVAPSESKTGHFLAAKCFDVIAKVTKLPAPIHDSVVEIVSNPGWLATTGEVKNPLAARLRFGSLTDFIGVNTEGTVYALDGNSGVALWIARFKLEPQAGEAKRSEKQFSPLVFVTTDGISRVVAAFDGGVRLLNGATGRELWRTDLPGRVASGIMVNTDRGPHLFLIGDDREKLFVLDTATGHLEAQTKLKSEAVGPPLLLTNKDSQSLLIPLKGGAVALHDTDGNQLRVEKLGADITTPPLLENGASGLLMIVGTKKGLLAFDLPEFKLLNRIAGDTEHYPVGELSAADLNGDKRREVVLTMNSGQLIAVTISDGAAKWSTEVANESAAAAFADVNGDGFLDVILPGRDAFAIVLSGLNGSVIWQSSERAAGSAGGKTRPGRRSLAIARTGEGRLMIVGNDLSSTGLRGLQVQRSSEKSHVP
jgi:outer membrane protein assembly factor BamB